MAHKEARRERTHGVDKPSHRDKKEKEWSSVGHGIRAHESRFNKERLAHITANRQEKFIEKVKADEKQGQKTHE